MLFPPLSYGILLRRYQRFLADIQLPSGEQITIHCPNTGAMTGCANAGDRVWFSTSNNIKRKYLHTWELTETQAGHFICVNTQRANQLVEDALKNKQIVSLANYAQIMTEVKYGEENSRVDFLLTNNNVTDCFMEVKSTTLLAENGLGMFPDTVTQRGQKHLRELIQMKEQGYNAVIFFAILHTGITRFEVAKQIDPKYAELFTQALKQGVKPLAYLAEIYFKDKIPSGMALTQRCEINL